MKIKYNSPVILTFAIVSAVTVVLNYITGGISNQLLFSTYRSPLLNLFTYVRLFTHVLGHSGWSHYFSNMLLFVLLGPMLEEKYGSKRILIVIASTAVVTGLINNIFSSSTMLLGTSGVVFAFVILSSLTAFKEKEIPLTFLIVLVMYIGQEVVNGLTQADNISQMAHIICGLVGAAYGFMFVKKDNKA